jgi:ferrous iron transport protein A
MMNTMSQTLDKLTRKQEGRILSVTGEGSLTQRLMALGFVPGSRVRIVEVAPFGDPIAVELDGWRVSIRKSEAAMVNIEEAQK